MQSADNRFWLIIHSLLMPKGIQLKSKKQMRANSRILDQKSTRVTWINSEFL